MLTAAVLIGLFAGGHQPLAAAAEQTEHRTDAMDEYVLPDLVISGDRVRDEIADGMLHSAGGIGFLGQKDALETPFQAMTFDAAAITRFAAPNRNILDVLSLDPAVRAGRGGAGVPAPSPTRRTHPPPGRSGTGQGAPASTGSHAPGSSGRFPGAGTATQSPMDSDPPPHPGQSTQPLPGPTGHVGRHGNVIGTSGHQHTSHRNGDTAHEPGNSPTNRNEVTPLTASTRSDAAAAQLTGSWRAAPPGTGGTGRRG